MDADKTRNENVEEKRNLGERGRGGRSFCRILGNGRGMWYITKRPYPPYEGRNGRKRREREKEWPGGEGGGKAASRGGWRRVAAYTAFHPGHSANAGLECVISTHVATLGQTRGLVSAFRKVLATHTPGQSHTRAIVSWMVHVECSTRPVVYNLVRNRRKFDCDEDNEDDDDDDGWQRWFVGLPGRQTRELMTDGGENGVETGWNGRRKGRWKAIALFSKARWKAERGAY